MLDQTEFTEDYAKEISTWKYDNAYSVYNFPNWDKIAEQKWAITIADKRKEEQVFSKFKNIRKKRPLA